MSNDDFLIDEQADPYNLKLSGYYSSFGTNQSYELDYFLSAIPCKPSSLQRLESASEAFDIAQISFKELVQRDIDHVRVKDIANDYLKAGKHRVLFFPPLLASLLIVKEDSIADSYEFVDEEPDQSHERFIYKKWNEDAFRARIPLKKTRTQLEDEGHPQGQMAAHGLAHGVRLEINTDIAKLVVIDGQHRLKALQHIANDSQNAHILAEANIPVCIVFSSNAHALGNEDERITSDLRELFVTINTEGKEVSGHFLTLLDDKSLSAICTRELAQAWKDRKIGSTDYPWLHLLEWNQRTASRASQVNRPFSITTISVIRDALCEYIFSGSKGDAGRSFTHLSLAPLSKKIAELGGVDAECINDDTFSHPQEELLISQMRDGLIPALDALFSKPSPYAKLSREFAEARAWLDLQVQENKEGALYYRDRVLAQFKDANALDPEGTFEVQDSFYSKFSEVSASYRLNVFQQGMIRSWVYFHNEVLEKLTQEQSALLFADCLDAFLYTEEGHELLVPGKVHTRHYLFKGAGDGVKVTLKAKRGWSFLISASLLHERSSEALRDGLRSMLSDKDQVAHAENDITSFALRCGQEYLEKLSAEITADAVNNWRDKGFNAQLMRRFERAAAHKNDPDSEHYKEFNKLIEDYVSDRLAECQRVLERIIGVQLSAD